MSAVAARGDGRRRGQALLPARRHRLRRDRCARSGPTSAPARSSRAARRSASSSSGTCTRAASRRSTARSRRPASRSSSATSGRSRGSSQTYLNTVYYGNHAYGVEAAAETYFSKHARRTSTSPQAALIAGPAAGAVGLRPAAQPEGGARAAQARCCRRCSPTSTITAQQYRWAVQPEAPSEAGQHLPSIKQPYFFSYVIDELESVYGANTVREGGLRVYTTIEPKLQYDANAAIRQTLNEPNDPAAAIVSVEPGHRRDPRDDGRDPGEQAQPVQPRRRSRPGRRARRSRRSCSPSAIEKGIDPDTTYYTSAPFTCTTGPWCVDDYEAGKPWTVHDLRPHLRRHDLDHERDPALGQHRLRAAHARRRARLRLADGASASAST